jgi:hypothetical protein
MELTIESVATNFLNGVEALGNSSNLISQTQLQNAMTSVINNWQMYNSVGNHLDSHIANVLNPSTYNTVANSLSSWQQNL